MLKEKCFRWFVGSTNKTPLSEVQFIFLYKKTKEIQHKNEGTSIRGEGDKQA